MHIATEHERARMGVEFCLVAQMQPKPGLSQHWTDDTQTLSSLHAQVPVYVVRPMIQANEFDCTNTLNSDIGDCCGCSPTPSSSKVSLKKDQFYPGEVISGRLACDNSACESAV